MPPCLDWFGGIFLFMPERPVSWLLKTTRPITRLAAFIREVSCQYAHKVCIASTSTALSICASVMHHICFYSVTSHNHIPQIKTPAAKLLTSESVKLYFQTVTFQVKNIFSSVMTGLISAAQAIPSTRSPEPCHS